MSVVVRNAVFKTLKLFFYLVEKSLVILVVLNWVADLEIMVAQYSLLVLLGIGTQAIEMVQEVGLVGVFLVRVYFTLILEDLSDGVRTLLGHVPVVSDWAIGLTRFLDLSSEGGPFRDFRAVAEAIQLLRHLLSQLFLNLELLEALFIQNQIKDIYPSRLLRCLRVLLGLVKR